MIQKRNLARAVLERSIGRWKADQDDPRLHDRTHVGLFYQYPRDPAILTKINGSTTVFDKEYNVFLKTINMTPIMIRQPALTVMDMMRKNINVQDNEQILLYGDPGHGKTHTLAHLLHFNYLEQNRFLINIRWLNQLTRGPKEHKISTSRPGRIDTPLDSAALLEQILTLNKLYFENHKEDLVCSKDYNWSARETTKAGEPLQAVIEHGISRVIHASDCVAVLIKELMSAANQGKIKLLTVIKKVDYLFHYKSGNIKHPDFKWVNVDEITVARALKKLVKGNHKNSLLIATCDDELSGQQNQTPESVLPEDGISYFERATRVLVPKYNLVEFENCYNFYHDIGWLARPQSKTQEVQDEVRYISGLNPGQVFRICKSL